MTWLGFRSNSVSQSTSPWETRVGVNTQQCRYLFHSSGLLPGFLCVPSVHFLTFLADLTGHWPAQWSEVWLTHQLNPSLFPLVLTTQPVLLVRTKTGRATEAPSPWRQTVVPSLLPPDIMTIISAGVNFHNLFIMLGHTAINALTSLGDSVFWCRRSSSGSRD